MQKEGILKGRKSKDHLQIITTSQEQEEPF